jgi:endonuclease/exonuclease/phosphatase family metal-dependent hydrolase
LGAVAGAISVNGETAQADAGRGAARADLPLLALVALATTLGMQCVRVTIPFLFYLLYGRFRIPAPLAFLAGVPILGAGFLFPLLSQKIGLRRTLGLSAGGLAIARLGAQVWRGDAFVDMVLALEGAALFFVALPALVAADRARSPESGGSCIHLPVGLALGLALDTSLHGAFLTYDSIWQPGAAGLALATGLSALTLGALGLVLRGRSEQDTSIAGAFPWGAVGCLLFLQLSAFENVARTSTLSGRELPAAFAFVLAGQLASVATALARPAPWSFAAAAVVLLASALPIESAPLLLASAVAGPAALMVLVARVASAPAPERPTARASCALTGIVMGGLVGLLYLPQAVPLPLSGGWAHVLAAAVIIFFAAKAGRGGNAGMPRSVVATAAIVALLALAGPLFVFQRWRIPRSSIPEGPIRIVTYNVHKGFSSLGALDLEWLAREIEAERPDVVALQEVSRGQITECGVDMASWMSQRLGLPCVYTPTGIPLWGQALLTAAPIARSENHRLPPNLPTTRTFSWTELDVGDGKPLRVVNTHYTALFGHEARRAHSEALVRFLGERTATRTVVMGDLNATPDSPPMRLLFDAGFVDAIEAAGIEPGYTAPAARPAIRIDYLLHSPDLEASDVTIRESLASDHLPVSATIRAR